MYNGCVCVPVAGSIACGVVLSITYDDVGLHVATQEARTTSVVHIQSEWVSHDACVLLSCMRTGTILTL